MITLTKGTMGSNDNMDGWVITSQVAIADGAEDMPLQKGDHITINGDVYRGKEFLGNVA